MTAKAELVKVRRAPLLARRRGPEALSRTLDGLVGDFARVAALRGSREHVVGKGPESAPGQLSQRIAR